MKQRKAIAYAYPTSAIADLHDQPRGCYYVQTSIQREDGSWSVGSDPVGADTFEHAGDPDLAALFAEVEGEVCPHFKRFATPEAARAAGILPKKDH